jgi:hypothetical protein
MTAFSQTVPIDGKHKQAATCPREKRKTKSGKEQMYVILPMFADEKILKQNQLSHL